MSEKRKTGPRYRDTVRLIDKEAVEAVKTLRKSLRISQVVFAERAGVSTSVIQRLEQGKNIERKSADPIAQALGKSFQDLFGSASGPAIPTTDGLVRHETGVSGQATVAVSLKSTESKLTELERIAGSELYYYKSGHVSAIRLFGAADEFIAPEDIRLHYQHEPYSIPPDIRPYAQKRIKELQQRAEREDKIFFDGPCVRLLHWQASPPAKGPGATLERNIVKLFLGPVGWFQYEGTNGFIKEELHPGAPSPYEYWIGLSKLINDFDVRHSKLSNIFDNAITIFTQDGKVGYQERRNRQSAAPGQLSSAVAENTNRYFDEANPNNPLQLMNSFPYEMKLSDGPDNKSCKPVKGVPHPVAAVRRGLNEETSWRMTEFLPERGIKLTGLAFGLDSLHPDALWIVCVNLTADAFEHECKTHRGKDWFEARIRFVPASFTANETQRILQEKGWIPGGKAALVRAIELIETIGAKRKIPAAKVFGILATT